MKRNMKKKIHEEVGFPIIDHIDHKKESGAIYSYPYPCGKDQYQKLINFCNENDLNFVVGADTTYHPTGTTVEIKIFDNH